MQSEREHLWKVGPAHQADLTAFLAQLVLAGQDQAGQDQAGQDQAGQDQARQKET